MKKTIVSALIVAGALLFANCHPKMHKSKSAEKTTETAAPPATPEQMAQGKTIYDAQCGKCHDLPKAGDYTEKRWNKILPDMIAKANVNAADARLVRAYVMANVKHD